MRMVLESAARHFAQEEHIRNVADGDWVDLFDEEGRKLEGIRGRMGATGVTVAGHEIGADLIEMQPGSAFPLHVHPGDHILYVLSGPGVVHVDGVDHRADTGDTIFIPAEYPHGVKTFTWAPPLVFLAVGCPHKHVSARDRMRLVSAEGNTT